MRRAGYKMLPPISQKGKNSGRRPLESSSPAFCEYLQDRDPTDSPGTYFSAGTTLTGKIFSTLYLIKIFLGAIFIPHPLPCTSENNLAPSYLQWLFT